MSFTLRVLLVFCICSLLFRYPEINESVNAGSGFIVLAFV